MEPTNLITEAFSGVSAGLLLNVVILLSVWGMAGNKRADKSRIVISKNKRFFAWLYEPH